MTVPAGIATLSLSECWTRLRASEVGRLAVLVEDAPDIYPVNFTVDHGTVVFRTAEGTKLDAAVQSSAVAFEADGYEPAAGRAWSVVVKGRAERIQRIDEVLDTATLPLFPWHAAPKQHFIRIVPNEVSGRAFEVVDRSAWVSSLSETRAGRHE